MKLENQVVSLDLAKRLKELGVKQESLYSWWVDAHGTDKRELLIDHEPRNPQGGWVYYAAFTVAELGEMLPKYVLVNDLPWTIRYDKTSKAHFIQYRRDEFNLLIQHGDTEADARAKMLIYLIENKLTPQPPTDSTR